MPADVPGREVAREKRGKFPQEMSGTGIPAANILSEVGVLHRSLQQPAERSLGGGGGGGGERRSCISFAGQHGMPVEGASSSRPAIPAGPSFLLRRRLRILHSSFRLVLASE